MSTGDIKVFIKKLNPKAQLPKFSSLGAAGADLSACLDDDVQVIKIPPDCWILVPCGFAMEIPEGYEAQIRPRSGLAYKDGITVLNTPGTIDSDYRGEVKVLLINLGERTFDVHHGDRIAQMVINQVPRVIFKEVERELSKTERGEAGYGSTGK